MSVLFILGRPAAGKTTVACRLKTRIEARNPLVRIAMIDEYAILQESVRGPKPPAITWHPNGTFELLDRTFLSKTALELEARAFSHMQTHNLILCELARAAYNELFDTFGGRITASMRILYIHAPPGSVSYTQPPQTVGQVATFCSRLGSRKILRPR